ncbi:MAG: hypothetical protein WDO73_29230 [Ignavibacteriota bacterium]
MKWSAAGGRSPGEADILDKAIQEEPPASLMSKSPIHAAMEGVIAGCMVKDPAQRRQRIQNAVIELRLAGAFVATYFTASAGCDEFRNGSSSEAGGKCHTAWLAWRDRRIEGVARYGRHTPDGSRAAIVTAKRSPDSTITAKGLPGATVESNGSPDAVVTIEGVAGRNRYGEALP